MAGYEAKDGKQLALALDNVKVTLYLAEGQRAKAIDHFEQAVRLNPQHAEAGENLRLAREPPENRRKP